MTIIHFHKNPSAVLDYSLDWTDFLAGGDTISASTWSADSSDITLASDSFTNTTTTVWVASGIVGDSYDLVNHITTTLGRQDERVIEIYIVDEPNELSDLVSALRLHLGDTDSTAYRYMDAWLTAALETAVKALQRWWGSKYLLIGSTVIRNPDYAGTFTQDSPPEIQQSDERVIILMASILVKSGQLESNSWQVGSWRDAEIAVSNIEGSRAKQFGMNLDWQELQMYLKSPQKMLWAGERVSPPEDDEWVN